ncbi:MAG: glycerate kinase, partial [Cellvibrionaceae bacterium]|nr:glycerate kinase [Cellvibrionaceae bacterium]
RELGAQQARQAMQLAAAGCKRPQLLLSGGETTVTVKGQGRGGRNTEFLLGFAQQLMAEPELSGGIYGLAADTDGIDGSEDNAGAYWGPEFIELARAKGLNAAAFLQDNDSYHFFKALNALLVSGPTRTNINDFRAVLVLPG